MAEKAQLHTLPWNTIGEAHQARLDALLSGPELHGKQARIRYLTLWRSLPSAPRREALSQLTDDQYSVLRRWWALLPAHPDAPGIPLWPHLSLTAALAGAATPDGHLRPAFLLVNVADAQPFIARARRTQDLWAGSYLLSFLCWQMVRWLAERYGPDCVLSPGLRGQPLADLWLQQQGAGQPVSPSSHEARAEGIWISNLPNFFTAIVPADEAETAAQNAVAAAFACWDDIAEAVRKRVHTAAGRQWDDYCERLWQKQNAHIFRDNVFWQVLPWPAGQIGAAEIQQFERLVAQCLPATGRLQESLSPPQQTATPPDDPTGHVKVGGSLYGDASRLAALLLADRKRLRDFIPVEEPGQKCTLSGVYQAVSRRPRESESSLAAASSWWNALATARSAGPSKMAGRIRRGEQLSAVYTVKRFALQAYFGEKNHRGDVPYLERHQFPSTAGIANGRVIARLLQLCASDPAFFRIAQAWQEAVKELMGTYFYPASLLPAWRRSLATVSHPRDAVRLRRIAQVDGEFLYPEALEKETLSRSYDGFVPDADHRERAVAALHTLRGTLHKHGLPAPTRYLAIIALDGDAMGGWVSGKKSTVPLSPALHQGLTAALSGFALQDAQHLIEQQAAGKLIYAGGDDVLALLPVADLLPTMDALYRAFRGTEYPGSAPYRLEGADFSGFIDGPQGRELRLGQLTLSAGVVLVHEATPLTVSVEAARAAEEEAKEGYGRDAFCIRLLRRGGAPVEIGAKWRLSGVSIPRLVEMSVELMRQGTLSAQIAFAMRAQSLDAAEGATGPIWVPAALSAARIAAFRRLAARHTTALSGGEPLALLQTWREQAERVLSITPGETATAAEKERAGQAWTLLSRLLLLARAIVTDTTGDLRNAGVLVEEPGA